MNCSRLPRVNDISSHHCRSGQSRFASTCGQPHRLQCRASCGAVVRTNFRHSRPSQLEFSGGNSRRHITSMGNKATGGPFAPLVVAVRNVMGVKEFNQFRGKAIALHSQVIKEFGGQIGVDTKQVQGLIRLAKKNGERLGFLA